jgi:hypothetical protein
MPPLDYRVRHELTTNRWIMSDKGIVLKIDECKILQTIDDMCAESLPPYLHDQWEEIKTCLIETRKRLEPLSPTVGDIAALIKKRETPKQ